MDGRLEYVQAAKRVLMEEYSSPSVELIRFFANRVCSSTSEQAVDRLAPIVKEALRLFARDQATDWLASTGQQRPYEKPLEKSQHVISDEEFEGFFVVNVT